MATSKSNNRVIRCCFRSKQRHHLFKETLVDVLVSRVSLHVLSSGVVVYLGTRVKWDV